MDYQDLTTAHQEYQAFSQTYIKAIQAEQDAEQILLKKEQAVHEKYFGKVLTGERTMAIFNELLKNQTLLEKMELKKCTKIKQIAREQKEAAEQNLNIIKRLKDV